MVEEIFSRPNLLGKICLTCGMVSGLQSESDFMRITCSLKSLPPRTPLLYSKTGVYRGIYFFLSLLQNTDCGYSLEKPQQGGSNVYSKSVEQKY